MSSDTFPACDAPPGRGSVAEHESRRGSICGAKYPCFGFGPPMTRPGVAIWACYSHRQDVRSQIIGSEKPSASQAGQGALL